MKLSTQQIEELKTLINLGYVDFQKHIQDLYIYKYSRLAQYENIWETYPLAMMCRGLILDSEYNIISRPFSKFFNFEEIGTSIKFQEIPNTPFKVYDKLDGSLGISYFVDGVPYIATQGSFTSEQAIKATEILHTKYKDSLKSMHPKETYLFEIIYPENRIVLNYGNLEDIILLRVIDTFGNENDAEQYKSFGFNVVECLGEYNNISEIHKLKNLDIENKEGYVLVFSGNFRVKVKFETYIKLHKVITGTSTIDIWECLKNKISLDVLIEDIPDEFYDFIKSEVYSLNQEYSRVENEYKKLFENLDVSRSRKEIAEEIISLRNLGYYSSILFCMLDNKDYSEYIWNLIKPDLKRWRFN